MSRVEAPPASLVEVYSKEHVLTLVLNGTRIVTDAVVTGWGTWNICLGRIPVGPGHARRTADGLRVYRPGRLAWRSVGSRKEAAEELYAIGNLIAEGGLRRAHIGQ